MDDSNYEMQKEVFISALKNGIRNKYPAEVAEIYCHNLDNAKSLANLLEEVIKQISNCGK